MDNFDTIQVEVDSGGLVSLTLKRPKFKNAFNQQMILELQRVLSNFKKSPEYRCLIIKGEGDVFCAGGDLNWMKESRNKDRKGRIVEAKSLAQTLLDLYNLKVPTFAEVTGDVYGGGVGLIAACDFVFSLDSVKYSLSETRLGLIPATIAPFLINKVGKGSSKELFLSTRPIKAERAKELGLVTKIFPDSKTLRKDLQIELGYILGSAPGALEQAKLLHHQLGYMPPNETLQFTSEALADRWDTKEAQLGIDAFLNKEKPPWGK
ncbi:MAG: enoyl-CoA hydratase-related protein [Paracoccaceae bacterium]|nr:enoyl-CoA hydratase-related protein [Paracoccaceae bacterium]